MNDKLPTQFAPAERASAADLLRQSRYFADAPSLLSHFLNAVPDILTVLNRERQIVFANQRLLTFLGVTLEDVLGLRPGEAVNCAHAFDTECGCGTTEFCSTCGAAQAILACQQGQVRTQECRIIQRHNEGVLDLKVWATPLEVESELFTIFSLTDISHEKRRQALERIFFHDVMNTATVLLSSTYLLQEEQRDGQDMLIDLISTNVEKIVEEIETQRQLTQAENDELPVKPILIVMSAFLQGLAAGYSHHPIGLGRHLRIEVGAEGITLVSDPILLRRVIENMIKNALEACQPGQTVTLGCERRADRVEVWVHNPNPIPRKVQLQIFQRSYSTKGTGRGLGTYSMKLLGERYLKGTVTFTSGAEGTTFRISCPASLDH